MCSLGEVMGVRAGGVVRKGWLCTNSTPSTGIICTGSNSSWYGVSCDRYSNVVGIGLTYTSLRGTLPSAIGQLTSLTFFSVNANILYGTIPTSVGLLTSLKYLFVGQNYFTGTIPSVIGSLVSITQLSWGSNKLKGTLPTSLGLLSKIYYLDVSSNSFTGDLPDKLCYKPYLYYLYLSGNNFVCINLCLDSINSKDYLRPLGPRWCAGNYYLGRHFIYHDFYFYRNFYMLLFLHYF